MSLYSEKPARGIVRDCKHNEGAFHDCAYVDLRNKVIDIASTEASDYYNKVKSPSLWDRKFMELMQRLTMEELEHRKKEGIE